MIRDRLVCGIKDTRIQRRLLQDPNLTYKEAFKTAQAIEIAARGFQDISQQQHQNIKPIAVHRFMDKTGRSPTTVAATIKCFRCCVNQIFKNGHAMLVGRKVIWLEFAEAAREFQPQLRLSRIPPRRYTTHTIYQFEPGRPGLIRQIHFFYFKGLPHVYTIREDQTYCGHSSSAGTWPSHGIRYRGFPLTYLTYSNLSSILGPPNSTLTTYTGEKIFPLGSTNVQVNYQSQCASLPLLVVPGDGPTLLGHNWLEEIKINWSDIKILSTFSTLEQVLDQHSAVFTSSIGKLKKNYGKYPS